MKLKDSTINYLQNAIEELSSLMKSEEKISDAELIEAVNFATDRLNLSSRQLASKFGVTPSTISRWKNGKNMPISFARKAIFEQIIKYANEQAKSLQKSVHKEVAFAQ